MAPGLLHETLKMLLKATDWFHQRAVQTSDGHGASLRDLIFSDRVIDPWRIRYAVVRVGRWLLYRDCLIRPEEIARVDYKRKRLHITRTKKDLDTALELDDILPVRPERQDPYYGFFRWPYLWTGSGVFGVAAEGPLVPVMPEFRDSHLRSVLEERGYQLILNGEKIGVVEDFLVDPHTWSIRYFLVEPEHGMGHGYELWPTSVAYDVSWIDREIHVRERPAHFDLAA